ncbi:MAG: single-stranded DNA-binding protein [Ruminococcus sp.]|nr:single-stranded DNA-binding protein [Ruminococcus sp.]
MNKVILMGRLCADPEFRQTQSGVASCRIRVAVNRPFANKQTGEREADFINVTCWRQTAEFVNRYFRKGNMIAVEGSLRNNDWTDQNGVKHYTMDVQADNVHFCESRNSNQNNNGGYAPSTGGYQANYQQPSYAQPAAPAPAPAPQQAAAPQQSVQLGDLGDFEEILSDGEVPF